MLDDADEAAAPAAAASELLDAAAAEDAPTGPPCCGYRVFRVDAAAAVGAADAAVREAAKLPRSNTCMFLPDAAAAAFSELLDDAPTAAEDATTAELPRATACRYSAFLAAAAATACALLERAVEASGKEEGLGGNMSLHQADSAAAASICGLLDAATAAAADVAALETAGLGVEELQRLTAVQSTAPGAAPVTVGPSIKLDAGDRCVMELNRAAACEDDEEAVASPEVEELGVWGEG